MCDCLCPSHVAFLLLPKAAGTRQGDVATAAPPHRARHGDDEGRREELIISQTTTAATVVGTVPTQCAPGPRLNSHSFFPTGEDSEVGKELV